MLYQKDDDATPQKSFLKVHKNTSVSKSLIRGTRFLMDIKIQYIILHDKSPKSFGSMDQTELRSVPAPLAQWWRPGLDGDERRTGPDRPNSSTILNHRQE